MSSKFAEVDISQIAGNASDDVKKLLTSRHPMLWTPQGFAHEIFNRLKVTEISIQPKAEEPEKMEARVVLETIVENGASSLILKTLKPDFCPPPPTDMVNGAGGIHGACSALLVDK
jgi:acyl-coenzyme A thioesterase 13